MTSPRGLFRRMPSDDDLSREDDYDSEAEWARARTASPYTSAASSSSASPPPHEPVSLFGDDEWDEKEWTREVVVPVAPPKRRKHSKAASLAAAPETPRTVYVPVTPVIVEPVAAMEDDEHDPPAIAYSRHSAVELVREDTIDSAADETYVAPLYPRSACAYLSALSSPSCGYVLRRQWATFALHTRLSAHRIARRARRAVSVGT
ncbi:hypothetical protein FRC09_013924 [Ceratobasidium sp. 395]|nr:hypothetical protein FRC09_013924 [Ceratobasidium sp. 395]